MNLKACMFFNFVVQLLRTFPFIIKCTSQAEKCFLYKPMLEIITDFSDFVLDTILPYFFITGTAGSLVKSNLSQF